MKLQELRDLMKQHNIKGSSYLNKPAIVSLLIEKGVLDSDILEEKECAKRELEEMRKRVALILTSQLLYLCLSRREFLIAISWRKKNALSENWKK